MNLWYSFQVSSYLPIQKVKSPPCVAALRHRSAPLHRVGLPITNVPFDRHHLVIGIHDPFLICLHTSLGGLFMGGHDLVNSLNNPVFVRTLYDTLLGLKLQTFWPSCALIDP